MILHSLILVGASFAGLDPGIGSERPAALEDLLGCWEHGEGEFLIRFQATRVIVNTRDDDPDRPNIRVYQARYEPGRVSLRSGFETIEWKVEVLDEGIRIVWPLWEGRLRRLDRVPDSLTLRPAPIAESPVELTPHRLDSIQRELRARALEDDKVRRKLDQELEMVQRDEYVSLIRGAQRNGEYLKKLIAEVGWIDADRFGAQAARDAFAIVRHSLDLPLIRAALPWIEKDARAGILDADDYAHLFDQLRLYLAEKQRYGTRVLQNDRGEWVIAFLEDPDRLAEFRGELGLGPVSEVAAEFEKKYGRPVRVVRGDE
jgi:hypothetical protein